MISFAMRKGDKLVIETPAGPVEVKILNVIRPAEESRRDFVNVGFEAPLGTKFALEQAPSPLVSEESTPQEEPPVTGGGESPA